MSLSLSLNLSLRVSLNLSLNLSLSLRIRGSLNLNLRPRGLSGSPQKPPRRHQKAPRRHQEAPRRPWTSWSQNVSYHMRLRTKVMGASDFACTEAT